MSDADLQELALISLTHPVGDEDFVLLGFQGREAISELFAFELELVSENLSIDPSSLVGQSVTWTVSPEQAPVSYFNGFISRLHAAELSFRDRRIYRAHVVPWLWFLTRTTDCRIFQNQSVPDIVQQIFNDHGFADFDFGGVTGDHPVHEYRVQYRETAFNFVARLLEEEGIFYYFKHQDGRHVLTLADNPSSFRDSEKELVTYSSTPSLGCISEWERSYEFRPGKWTLKDYNFETPDTELEGSAPSVLPVKQMTKYEVYDYPGGFLKTDRGKKLAELRIEQEETGWDVVRGRGAATTFHCGKTFSLDLAPEYAGKTEVFAVLGVEHRAHDLSNLGVTTSAPMYSNQFWAAASKAKFRPARFTPRPTIQGPQTALVVGPSGEEIYADKYGRVKVQFYWDRLGKKDANSSAYLRVVQGWAGNQWGAQILPRIGMEVLIVFLEGDPDRPIVAGCLYNASNMPTFPLPGQKTKSGWRTRSSLNGSSSNFSEFSIDDKKGNELVFLHAEKDHTIEVEHDQKLTVDNCRIKTVKADETVTIGGNQKIEIQKGNRDTTIDMGNDTLLLKQGNLSTTLSMGNMSVELKLGNLSTKAGLGKIDETAMQGITMTVGSSSIKIDQMGVTIKGMMITIEGQIQTQVKGLMTQVNGSAMLQAQGGIIMIG